jgi:hypothetical protein
MPTNNAALWDKAYYQDYTYPDGLDLRPGSEFHDFIVQRVLELARYSFGYISQRHEDWTKVRNKMQAFIPLKDAEKKTKLMDPNRPVPVVIPLQLAVYDSRSTQLFSMFSADEEIHQLEGVGPEDTIAAACLEKVLALQSNYYDELDTVNTNIYDTQTCGLGASTVTWEEERGPVRTSRPATYLNPATGEQEEIEGPPVVEFDENGVLFEGNRVRNIDPYYLLPDPSQPVHKVQDMEFCGYLSRSNRSTMMMREAVSEGAMFNCKYLTDLQDCTSKTVVADLGEGDRGQRGHDLTRGFGFIQNPESYIRPVDTITFYVRLIPEEWKMRGTMPELWIIEVSADMVVTSMGRITARHRRIPIAIDAPDTDGHSSTPLGRLETVYPAQEGVDALWNARMRQVLNSLRMLFAIDPDRVNMNDVVNMGKTNYIRVSRLAYGTPLTDALHQLAIQDTTQNTMGDIFALDQWMQRTASPDTLSGMAQTKGERRSATEMRGQRTSALSRMDKTARLISIHYMKQIGFIMACNTQDYMSQASWVKIAGRYEEELRAEYGQSGFARVNPADIDCRFDVRPLDATNQGSDFLDSWVQLYQMIIQNPILLEQLDIFRIFKHIARLGGAKNVSSFIKSGGQVQGIVPSTAAEQGQMEQMIQQGNLVPLAGAFNG